MAYPPPTHPSGRLHSLSPHLQKENRLHAYSCPIYLQSVPIIVFVYVPAQLPLLDT